MDLTARDAGLVDLKDFEDDTFIVRELPAMSEAEFERRRYEADRENARVLGLPVPAPWAIVSRRAAYGIRRTHRVMRSRRAASSSRARRSGRRRPAARSRASGDEPGEAEPAGRLRTGRARADLAAADGAR